MDATADNGRKGRLLNHSRTAANLVAKVIEVDGPSSDSHPGLQAKFFLYNNDLLCSLEAFCLYYGYCMFLYLQFLYIATSMSTIGDKKRSFFTM